MSLKSEQQLLDFAKWYEHNRKGITDPMKFCEFQDKAIESLGLVCVELINDIKILEGRGPVGKSMKKIITPDNVLARNNG